MLDLQTRCLCANRLLLPYVEGSDFLDGLSDLVDCRVQLVCFLEMYRDYAELSQTNKIQQSQFAHLWRFRRDVLPDFSLPDELGRCRGCARCIELARTCRLVFGSLLFHLLLIHLHLTV